MPGFELIDKKELNEIKNIFNNGSVLFRHGFERLRKNIYKVRRFEENFKKKIKSKYSLAVTSGTSALRVALEVLDLKPNDEVITQCFTFVATVEAIIESGAKPVCTDVDKTLNMDPNDLKKRITKNTKVVIAVHMLGTPARLDEIKKICKKNNIILIEDTAWGCGGKYKDKYLGTIGRMGTFSFDFAKSLTTGEEG
jgi:8-amino-3,8-dideoxy-alpha-D-manno-octulosonate transaminase